MHGRMSVNSCALAWRRCYIIQQPLRIFSLSTLKSKLDPAKQSSIAGYRHHCQLWALPYSYLVLLLGSPIKVLIGSYFSSSTKGEETNSIDVRGEEISTVGYHIVKRGHSSNTLNITNPMVNGGRTWKRSGWNPQAKESMPKVHLLGLVVGSDGRICVIYPVIWWVTRYTHGCVDSNVSTQTIELRLVIERTDGLECEYSLIRARWVY